MSLKVYEEHFDVIVVGGGLGSLQAAISAAKRGAKVLLSTKVLFGGSSFYPNTWGLGMVGPDGEKDIDNFISTIMSVGSNINNKEMVEVLVREHEKTIEIMKEDRIPLMEPSDSNQKEFIPCFDYKKRKWYGLESKNLIQRYKELLDEYEITVKSHEQLVDLIATDNVIKGIITSNSKELVAYYGKSVVLATGGMGNVFKRSLNTSDVSGISQYLAMRNGAELTNLEFQQMMFGYSDVAYKTIYNEKVFKYTDFTVNDKTIFNEDEQKYLALRSEHGPFTSQRDSKYVDLKILENINNGHKVKGQYSDEMFKSDSEFIKNYFDWMIKTKRLDIKAPFEIDMFYHAANGGIKIDENGATSIHGLFACGEVTGGIHGADRIGGLTTSSALVFGRISGISASEYASEIEDALDESQEIKQRVFKNIKDVDSLIVEVQDIMQINALVIREEEGLTRSLDSVKRILKNLEYEDSFDVKGYSRSVQLLSNLHLSQAILNAAILRKESRGSHYRKDYPTTEIKYEKRSVSKMIQEEIITEWEN